MSAECLAEPGSITTRRHKRKDFEPRNISQQISSSDEEDEPLDLSGGVGPLSKTPDREDEKDEQNKAEGDGEDSRTMDLGDNSLQGGNSFSNGFDFAPKNGTSLSNDSRDLFHTSPFLIQHDAQFLMVPPPDSLGHLTAKLSESLQPNSSHVTTMRQSSLHPLPPLLYPEPRHFDVFSPSIANVGDYLKGPSPPIEEESSSLALFHKEKSGSQPPSLDYSKYVQRFANSSECGQEICRTLNHREHFHCFQCKNKVLLKKEEMIRHFKWHKKRDDSLQHGFLRYSPTDDCSDRFSNCAHNRRQTHYHCIREGCEKVYISTSDVQMHANYHRKDSAIIQEGFQRFRASEQCGDDSCPFSSQRTTHFHCRRPGCRYTFKNKSDMEKHKAYHIKDEQLTKDGFKKFLKHESCPFTDCRFSKVCNHIHCIRPGCEYVLHSSGQLFSHKRKHERQESEPLPTSTPLTGTRCEEDFRDRSAEVSWNKYLVRHSGGCESTDNLLSQQDHIHCTMDDCGALLPPNNDTAVKEHCYLHEIQEQVTAIYYRVVKPGQPCLPNCPFLQTHYHCKWEQCGEVISKNDPYFNRFDHFRFHQMLVAAGHDGVLKKKRGRPPKTSIDSEVPVDTDLEKGSSSEVPLNFSRFSSLPEPSPSTLPSASPPKRSRCEEPVPPGYEQVRHDTPCERSQCGYSRHQTHFHCLRPECGYGFCDKSRFVQHTARHERLDTLMGGEFRQFRGNVGCGSEACPLARVSHFHCSRCPFVCTDTSKLVSHRRHHLKMNLFQASTSNVLSACTSSSSFANSSPSSSS